MRETRVLFSAFTVGILSLAAAHVSSVAETAAVPQAQIQAVATPSHEAMKEKAPVSAVQNHVVLSVHEEPVQKHVHEEIDAALLAVVNQEDILEKHRIIADDTLRTIDGRCREKLTNFYVRYDNPESRGLGGGGTIILSGNVPDDEFRALLIHECAHVIDTGMWNGTAAAGASAFKDHGNAIFNDDKSLGFYMISWSDAETKKENMKKEDFVSGYASWNAFEDFAESFALYTLHKEEFEKRAEGNEVLMQKYLWLAANIEQDVPVLSGYEWNGTVPWDTTKLKYRWMNAEVATVR